MAKNIYSFHLFSINEFSQGSVWGFLFKSVRFHRHYRVSKTVWSLREVWNASKHVSYKLIAYYLQLWVAQIADLKPSNDKNSSEARCQSWANNLYGMLSVGGSHRACNEAMSCVSNHRQAGLNALWQATEWNNKPQGGRAGGKKKGEARLD